MFSSQSVVEPPDVRLQGKDAGLAESNGSLRMTACTHGSAPDPTLGNEYGRTLPFMLYLSVNCFQDEQLEM